MIDSSFITSPLSPEFSDVWSEPELLSEKGHNAIYVATRFGRRYILKALAAPFRDSTPYIEMLRKEFSIGVGVAFRFVSYVPQRRLLPSTKSPMTNHQ